MATCFKKKKKCFPYFKWRWFLGGGRPPASLIFDPMLRPWLNTINLNNTEWPLLKQSLTSSTNVLNRVGFKLSLCLTSLCCLYFFIVSILYPCWVCKLGMYRLFKDNIKVEPLCTVPFTTSHIGVGVDRKSDGKLWKWAVKWGASFRGTSGRWDKFQIWQAMIITGPCQSKPLDPFQERVCKL